LQAQALTQINLCASSNRHAAPAKKKVRDSIPSQVDASHSELTSFDRRAAVSSNSIKQRSRERRG
jgi:hypothetical protein